MLGPAAEGDRGGCGVGVHNLAASTYCTAQHSTAHVPAVVILILRVEPARVRSIVVLSVVTPVNQPDTAPGVVPGPAQWSPGPD